MAKYHKHLKPPGPPPAKGLFAMKAKAELLGTLRVLCLIDCTNLHNKPVGRKRIICKKPSCFRAYRNAYNVDLDAEAARAKL